MMKAAPRVGSVARTARCLAAAPRINHRSLHVTCQAQGPQDPKEQQQAEPIQRNAAAGAAEGTGMARRNEVVPAPAPAADLPVPFLRMSDYIDSMQREMESMFDMFGAPSVFRRSPLSLASVFDSPTLTPAFRTATFDVEEDEKEYRIMADVPGFSRENIRVAVSNGGVLKIEGNMTEETGGETSGYHSRRVQNFERRFRLPPHVNHDDISARVENGVLRITLPKAAPEPEAPAKEIPIN